MITESKEQPTSPDWDAVGMVIAMLETKKQLIIIPTNNNKLAHSVTSDIMTAGMRAYLKRTLKDAHLKAEELSSELATLRDRYPKAQMHE